MPTPSRPITLLLAIITALLAASLIANVPPQEATAQPSLRTAAVPHVIQVEVGAINTSLFRLWSDGRIEEAIFDGPSDENCIPAPNTGFGWQVVPETVPPPPARIVRLYSGIHLTAHLLRLRSDGVVERNDLVNGSWCGWRLPPE